MNHIYRLVWSQRHSKFVVAHEKTRTSGCSSTKVSSSVASVLLSSLLVSPFAWAAPPTANTLPTGAQVTAGAAAITSSGNTMNVQQSTQRAAINWTNFNIGSNATVNFQQPNASAVVLNRVVGNEQSVINGALNANGQVFLLNSSGVLFGQGAQVNVGGLVASTLNMTDADFMAGRNTLQSTGSQASVINLGQITAADGGYVALLGNQVSNQGVISARLGTAALAAGDKISLNFNGNSLVGVTIDQGTLNGLVENKQAIYADGGRVYLTTQAVDTVLNGVVNNTGLIQANSVGTGQNGEVILYAHGGTVDVGGTIKADGGFVETSGKQFAIQPNATVQAANWLIDPVNITIDSTLAGTIQTALGGGNVTISTAGNNTPSTSSGQSGTDGDITVNSAITWSANNMLTLHADRNIHINAAITASGASGAVTLEYGQGAVAASNTSTYDFGLTSSGFAGKINLQAGQNFNTKLGNNGTAVNWTVITALGNATDNQADGNFTLQGIDRVAYGSRWFALGASIDASATRNWNGGAGFDPIGDYQSASTGLNGLGHTVSDLYIHNTSNGPAIYVTDFYGNLVRESKVGLIAQTSGIGSVSNLRISNPDIYNNAAANMSMTGAAIGYLSGAGSSIYNVMVDGGSVSGASDVGGLAGNAQGSSVVSSTVVMNSFSTATVTALAGNGFLKRAGGLIGNVRSMTISQSYATGSVNNADSSEMPILGGLVGYARNVSIDQSYATGSVNAGNFSSNAYAGGLIGQTYSRLSNDSNTISNSYALGSVTTGTGPTAYVGGLIGGWESTRQNTFAAISNVYAAGAVSSSASTSYLGGLFGSYRSTEMTLTNAFWDTQTTGQTNAYYDDATSAVVASAAGMAEGKATAQLKNLAVFTGTTPPWSMVNDSAILAGNYPVLRWATSGTSAGSSIWVIGNGVNYAVSGGNLAYGQTFSLPTPTYTGGTPTGTSTVKVYDSSNTDVTSQATAGTLAAGTYTVKNTLVDTNYSIMSSGNTDGTLVISAAQNNSNGSTPSTSDVERQAGNAIHAPREITRPQVTTPRESETGSTKPFSNVAVVPTDVSVAFNKEDPLAVLSSPNANEPTQTVSLTDAKKMLKSSTTSDSSNGGGAGGDREVRVPVSRNSLAEIVNGGVKLPTGVEQQLFVVKAN